MRWFSNMKIARKLILGFGAVALVAGLIGYIGIRELNKLDASSTEMYEYKLLPISQMSKISTIFQLVRVYSRDIILASSAEEIEKFAEEITSSREQVGQLSTEFEKRIQTDEMRAQFEQFKNDRKEYGRYLDELIVLARANKDDEAFALFKGNFRTVMLSEMRDISAMDSMNVAQAKTLADENNTLARESTRMMLIILVIGVVLAIFLGYYISRVIGNPVKELAEAADKLALGDMNIRIETDSRDEVGNLARSFGKMAATLRDLTNEARELTRAAVEGRLETRGNADMFEGGYREILQGVNDTLDAVIGPLNVAADYVAKISRGEVPEKITGTYNGDFNEIKNNLNHCIDGLAGLVEANLVLQRMAMNDYSIRVTGEYQGVFAEVARATNDVEDRMLNIIRAITNISKGDLSDLETYRQIGGGKGRRSENDIVVPTIIKLMETLKSLVADMKYLSDAAVAGRLESRADATKHEGDFREIVEGVNDTLDAVIGPLKMAAANINKIGMGEIPGKITDSYNGDFNEIKNSLNSCIDGLAGLIEANAVLQRMSVNDYSVSVAGTYQGVFAEVARATNDVQERVLSIVHGLDKISQGDFSELEKYRKIGRRSDNDVLLPIIIKLMDTLKLLIAEMKTLSDAAVAGRLETRADAAKHEGEFRDIVEGVNDTLDAVIGPLKMAAANINKIGMGEIPQKITDSYNGDFNEIKNSLNSCIDGLGGLVEANTVLEKMANNDLTATMTGEYQGIFNEVKMSLNKSIAAFNDILIQVSIAADQVVSGSQQVSDASQSLSQGATEQASSLEEITASMTEMTSQTRQNADNAQQANKLATAARDTALRGNDQMQQMLGAMKEINESSGQISKIIKVIDEIAFQTNLLALNAAVEAARAGVHGKGFAVVADEVRNLAQRSAKAAKETTELIETSIKTVDNGQGIAVETAKALNEIMSGVTKVTDLVGEIASASNEQAQGITQVNQGLGQVDQVTQANTASAEESASAAEELSGQAVNLKDMIGRFVLAGDTREARPGYGVMRQERAVMHSDAGRKTRTVSRSGNGKGGRRDDAGRIASATVSPSQVIALDDDEFGRY